MVQTDVFEHGIDLRVKDDPSILGRTYDVVDQAETLCLYDDSRLEQRLAWPRVSRTPVLGLGGLAFAFFGKTKPSQAR